MSAGVLIMNCDPMHCVFWKVLWCSLMWLVLSMWQRPPQKGTKLEGEEVPWRSVSGFILAYWFGYYGKQLLSKSNSIGAMFVGANEIFVVDVCDDLKFLVPRAFSPLGGDLPAVLV